MASISRLLKIIGLFCKRALFKRLYYAKENHNFKEPTNRSHPIVELSVSNIPMASDTRLAVQEKSSSGGFSSGSFMEHTPCYIIGVFAEYRLFNRSLLQKTPVILRNLLIVATPYLLRSIIRRSNICRSCLSRELPSS